MAEGRLAYMEWSVDPDDFDADDPEDWARANPAFGIRVSEEFVAGERAALPAAIFARERLGIPDPEPSDHGELAIDAVAWAACFDGRSKMVDQPSFAFDVSPDGRLASLAVAGMRADGLVHVEVLEHREPSVQWVVDLAAGLCERWKARLVIGPTSANAYKPDLERAKVPVVALSERELAAACVRFRLMVSEGQVRHLGSGDLNAAVATAVEQPMGDGFKFKRRLVGAPDLSPLYAVTLAAWPQQDEKAPLPVIY